LFFEVGLLGVGGYGDGDCLFGCGDTFVFFIGEVLKLIGIVVVVALDWLIEDGVVHFVGFDVAAVIYVWCVWGILELFVLILVGLLLFVVFLQL
jgi:hypothetical protein